MKKIALVWAGCMLAAIAAGPVVAASSPQTTDSYWHYQFKEFEVLAVGTERYAINLARNLDALDQTMTAIMGSRRTSRTPIRLYALPAQTMRALKRGPTEAFFSPSAYSSLLVMHAGGANDGLAYYGANFGFVHSLLLDQGLARAPDWYRQGISTTYAASTFADDTLSTGKVFAPHVSWLHAHGLWPMRKFLRMKYADPSLSDVDRGRYQAQSWFFVHSALFENDQAPQLADYVKRLMAGEDEGAAFAASFKMTYEELDKILTKTLDRGKINYSIYSMLDISAQVKPRRVPEIEVKARLAELMLERQYNPDYALQLANEVLAAEPQNERALYAKGRALLYNKKPTEVLKFIESLEARPSMNAIAHRHIGIMLQFVSTASRASDPVLAQAVTPEASVTLLQRAREHFRQALVLDPGDAESTVAYAEFLIKDAALDEMKAFMPQLTALYYRNADRGYLAGILASAAARMSAAIGNKEDAFKFGLVAERLALTEAARAGAADQNQDLRSELTQ